MDVAVPHSFRNTRTLQANPLPTMPAQKPLAYSRGLDGVRKEKQALLSQLREQSFSDTVQRVFRKWQLFFRRFRRLSSRLMPDLAPRQMLYGSLLGGVVFGMLSMALIAHTFGEGVFARSNPETIAIEPEAKLDPEEALLLESLEGIEPEDYSGTNDIFLEAFGEAAQDEYEDGIRKMVSGYPIEAMLPYIFEQNRLTAAFLIGIAKKESNWGKRVPVLDGQDCFNYWGYRGVRRMMGTGGHTCFNSRKDAVETVTKRLETLINSSKLDTPEKMIVWKCGYSCAGHSRESVKKWISDVDMYFSELNTEEE